MRRRLSRSQIAKSEGKGLSRAMILQKTIQLCLREALCLYGAAEAGRDYNTTDMSHLRMYNEYLLHIKACGRCGSRKCDGFINSGCVPATANKWLMTDVLRKQWALRICCY